MQLHNSKKVAYISLLTALALIFSYVESLIPLNFGIPGVKLGLANAVSVITIYLFGPLYAVFVTIIRVILSGLLFGNMFSILYSLAGGILSIIVMSFIRRIDKFSILGVSMSGGVAHNIGQLLVAVMVINQLRLYFYCPVLIFSGLIMGALIGIVCSAILKRVETYVRL